MAGPGGDGVEIWSDDAEHDQDMSGEPEHGPRGVDGEEDAEDEQEAVPTHGGTFL